VKRYALLGVLLFAVSIAAEPDAALMEHALTFTRHWQAFLLAYTGCPAAARDVAECRPALGSIDYREWKASREAAKALFDLREKSVVSQ
jgi:hypothetical protein